MVPVQRNPGHFIVNIRLQVALSCAVGAGLLAGLAVPGYLAAAFTGFAAGGLFGWFSQRGRAQPGPVSTALRTPTEQPPPWKGPARWVPADIVPRESEVLAWDGRECFVVSAGTGEEMGNQWTSRCDAHGITHWLELPRRA